MILTNNFSYPEQMVPSIYYCFIKSFLFGAFGVALLSGEDICE